jgi:hypothetical protein
MLILRVYALERLDSFLHIPKSEESRDVANVGHCAAPWGIYKPGFGGHLWPLHPCANSTRDRVLLALTLSTP